MSGEPYYQDAAAIARHTAARAAERARVKLTRDDIIGATHVRDRWGWHRVIAVNATTVGVMSEFSQSPPERIPFARILKVRR